MENFIYENPTKICFGNNVTDDLGKTAKLYGKKALFVYGMNSIKNNGLYDKVVKQLKSNKISIVEHGGVKGNPLFSHTTEGIKKAKQNNVDVIVAVGGGSVIDESKAIGISVRDTNFWKVLSGKSIPTKCLPIVAVLTLPATGTEMNGGFVITNDDTKEKFGTHGCLASHPRVSFLEPKYTCSIPLKQTAYACSDMLSHLLEGYLTSSNKNRIVTDFYVEAIAKSIIDSMRKILKNPNDIEARGSFMWSSTLAWNGIGRLGLKDAGIPSHALEHPLSAFYDIAHGAGLSMVKPAWMKFMDIKAGTRIISFGKNILGVKSNKIDDTIKALIKLYKEIGTPTNWKEAGISNPNFKELAIESNKLFALWGMDYKGLYSTKNIEKIYRLID